MKTHPRPRSRHRRRHVSAMTLVEIMVVIIIMAMIATAVGVAVIPQMIKAKETTARTNVAAIREAVGMWFIGQRSRDCPTVAMLVEQGVLSSQLDSRDPWDNDFEIICDGPEPEVHSAGPDGSFGTEDDI